MNRPPSIRRRPASGHRLLGHAAQATSSSAARTWNTSAARENAISATTTCAGNNVGDTATTPCQRATDDAQNAIAGASTRRRNSPTAKWSTTSSTRGRRQRDKRGQRRDRPIRKMPRPRRLNGRPTTRKARSQTRQRDRAKRERRAGNRAPRAGKRCRRRATTGTSTSANNVMTDRPETRRRREAATPGRTGSHRERWQGKRHREQSTGPFARRPLTNLVDVIQRADRSGKPAPEVSARRRDADDDAEGNVDGDAAKTR